MNQYSFYEAGQMRPLYSTAIPVYQEAFANWPWNERSKCADEEKRCKGGFSPLQAGHYCQICDRCTGKPAYEDQELQSRFDRLAATRPLKWFVESNSAGLNLFALAWRAEAGRIADEKYTDVPAMKTWLTSRYGDEPIVWLDETFADKRIQNRGNLRNFRAMCEGFVEQLGGISLAYRTKTPQMIRAAERDFGRQAEITDEVPDGRTFVEIFPRGMP